MVVGSHQGVPGSSPGARTNNVLNSSSSNVGRLIKGSLVGGALRGNTMGVQQHVRSLWKTPKASLPSRYRRDRMASWRREPVYQRIERPTRIDAARRVGYRAKQGVVVVRTRVRRGGLRRSKVHMKRKPSKAGIKKITMGKSIQRMAEERVSSCLLYTSPSPRD